jgi:hypothetical protein
MTTDTRSAVEQLVRRVLVDEHGAGAITRRPISRTIDIEVDRPADYNAGIAAARRIANAAEALMRDYAKRARGEGLSWQQIAPSLPIDLGDTDDPAAEAFVWVAPRPSQRFDRITTSWECASCGQRITDQGPYNGHPADDEHGHAEGCARHAEDIRAWRARSGWDEDEA